MLYRSPPAQHTGPPRASQRSSPSQRSSEPLSKIPKLGQKHAEKAEPIGSILTIREELVFLTGLPVTQRRVLGPAWSPQTQGQAPANFLSMAPSTGNGAGANNRAKGQCRGHPRGRSCGFARCSSFTKNTLHCTVPSKSAPGPVRKSTTHSGLPSCEVSGGFFFFPSRSLFPLSQLKKVGRGHDTQWPSLCH